MLVVYQGVNVPTIGDFEYHLEISVGDYDPQELGDVKHWDIEPPCMFIEFSDLWQFGSHFLLVFLSGSALPAALAGCRRKRVFRGILSRCPQKNVTILRLV